MRTVTVILGNETSDLGTPELRQHAIITTGRAEKGKRQARVETQVPIDYYKLRGWISQRQHYAGQEFYRLWYFGSEKANYIQMRYSNEPSSGQCDYETKHIMECKYNSARNSMLNVEVKAIVFRVCCLGEWAREAKTNPTQRVETVMKQLRLGLDGLIEHFGF